MAGNPFPADRFEVDTVWNSDSEYVDVEIVDRGRKGPLRAWRISKNLETNEWYGMLRRSETEEDPFDDGVYLPKRFLEGLVGVYGAYLDRKAGVPA